MKIDVVIDASRWPREVPESHSEARFPQLERMVARGEALDFAGGDFESCLRSLFGMAPNEPIPYAAWSLLGDGGEPGEEYWLRLDPIHLRPERLQLRLIPFPADDIGRDEASALAAALMPHLQAEGHELLALHPQRWYLRAAVELDRDLGAPEPGVLGESQLPAGAHGGYWRRLITESQMLLHELPVNQAREARGKLAVNAVWPWGGGRMRTLAAKPYAHVLSESPLARGMARTSGAEAASTTSDASALDARDGDLLLTLEAAGTGQLGMIESNWIAGLAQALARGRIDELRLFMLTPSDGIGRRVTRRRLGRWWRRGRPLRFHA